MTDTSICAGCGAPTPTHEVVAYAISGAATYPICLACAKRAVRDGRLWFGNQGGIVRVGLIRP